MAKAKLAKAESSGANGKGGAAQGVGGTSQPPTNCATVMSMDGATFEKIHRSRLREAPYNPRVIDQYAQQGLRESIRQTGGLVEAPVWNRRTGNLVAGHQRLAQSDVLAKGQDYTVTVAVVDVDEKTERELNVRLNNDTIRGAYDVAGIDDLLRGGADYQAMGFDLVSLENLYIGAGVDLDMSILLGGGRADSDEGDIDAGRQSAAEIEDQLDEADVAKQQEAERKKIAKIRERRKEFDAKAEFDYELECSSSIVFPTGAMRAAFMRAVGLDEHETRIDGVSLCRFLGLDVPEFRSIKEPSITKSVQEPGTGSETGIEKPASPGENVGVADSGSAETLPAGGVSLPPARPITKINLEI